jgi:hypothetical protein
VRTIYRAPAGARAGRRAPPVKRKEDGPERETGGMGCSGQSRAGRGISMMILGLSSRLGGLLAWAGRVA